MLHKLILEAAHTVVSIAFYELLARLVTKRINVFPLFLFSVILCSSHKTKMGIHKYLQYIIDIFLWVYMDGLTELYAYMPELIILQFNSTTACVWLLKL